MQAVSISQLRSNIRKYLDDISKSLDVLIVPQTTEDDAVVIISIKKYNPLTKTGYLLSAANNRKRLHESIDQLQKRKTVKYKLSK